MGWTYVRTSRDQLIRELTATEDTDRGRREVIDHALIDNVLWSVVRITAKQPGLSGLAAGESVCIICCDLLEASGNEWGYKSLVEVEHPYYYSCPLRFLAMAPEQCATWRALVRSCHARHGAAGGAAETTAG